MPTKADLIAKVKYVTRVYLCEWCDIDDLANAALKELADRIGVHDELELARDDAACADLDQVILSQGLVGSTKTGVKRIDLFRSSCVNGFNKLAIAAHLQSWPSNWRDRTIETLAEALVG